jgi:hypothetical protein
LPSTSATAAANTAACSLDAIFILEEGGCCHHLQKEQQIANALISASTLASTSAATAATAATCGYLRLPTATCGYLLLRQLLLLLLTRPNIEIALQNSCLCLKNLLMSRAISITRYSNQVL